MRLSTDLTAFLLNYNGGSDWRRITLLSVSERRLYTLNEFVRAVRTTDGPGATALTLTETARAFWDIEFDQEEDAAIAPTLLPVGVMNGLFLFERQTTDDASAIGICDGGDGELRRMRRLAPDLAAFLGMLRLRGGGS